MKLAYLNLLLPALHTPNPESTHLTPRFTHSYWTCSTAPNTRGPGRAGLETIQTVFTALYGPEPLALGPEEARVATCGGLLFGLWNGHLRGVTEKPGFREQVATRDPGEEGVECLGYGEDDENLGDGLRLSYMFGYGEDTWVSGGMTEVRRCED